MTEFAFDPAGRARRLLPRTTDVVFLGALLAAGVIGWQHLVHSYILGHADSMGGHLAHFLRDSLLALPLAMLAVGGGLWLRRRLFPSAGGLFHLLSGAGLTTIVFAALLVPSVPVHAFIDDSGFGLGGAGTAHAAELPGGQGDNHPASMGGLEGASDFGSLVLHGLRDTLMAQPVAFLVAVAGLGLLALVRRWQPRKTQGGAARWARLAKGGLAVAAVLLIGAGIFGGDSNPAQATHTRFTTTLKIPPVLTSANISISMAETQEQILTGNTTTMWTYNSEFPGPTIRRPTGQTTQVTFTNNIPANSPFFQEGRFRSQEMTIHHHGNHSTPENDGQPAAFLIPIGGSRVYTYTGTEAGGNERGVTQWYHDHRADVTGRNVWHGLAGFFILDDPADPQTLPKGEFEVPLLIADRQFDSQNQTPYNFAFDGNTGNHVLVNGVPQPFFDVGDRKYRFRVLNASNRRVYTLALSTGQSMTQIGTDSGLLPAPVTRSAITIGPAERVEFVIDFAGRLGQNIELRNTAVSSFDSTFRVMQFRVNRDLTDDSSVPSALRALPAIGAASVNRSFDFSFSNSGQWAINGLTFDPNRVDAFPKLNATEQWTLRNSGNWTHLIHIHDVDQHCVSRNGGTCPAYEVFKEVWNITGGVTFVVKLKFTDNVGRYPFHCHVLEHEDNAMMTQFEVVP